jgi:GTP pyrophosphokinase
MRREGLPLQRMLTHETLSAVASDLNHADVTALYAAVGEGNTTAQSVVRRILELFGGDQAVADEAAETVAVTTDSLTRRRVARGDSGVIVKGVSDVLTKLARCCTPVPGDEIVGFVTSGQGVSVHRSGCTNMKSLRSQPGRLVEVEWAPTGRSMFLVAVLVEGLDRAGLLSDITRVLSDLHVNILSATVTTNRDRVTQCRFTFEMGDVAHLSHVLKAVRGVNGVFDAYRITN